MPRSYQVTPGILGRRRATQPKKVRPTADSMEKGQPAADREPSRPRRTPPPDRLRLSLTWNAAVRDYAEAVRTYENRALHALVNGPEGFGTGPRVGEALTVARWMGERSGAVLMLLLRRDGVWDGTTVHFERSSGDLWSSASK